jgi:hypothetical protein
MLVDANVAMTGCAPLEPNAAIAYESFRVTGLRGRGSSVLATCSRSVGAGPDAVTALAGLRIAQSSFLERWRRPTWDRTSLASLRNTAPKRCSAH